MDGSPAERFRTYRRTGDRALRNALVEEHLPLAWTAARRFDHRGEPLADLVQVALLGLVKAVERYDPDRGSSFRTFALPTLQGELRRHFRDATWPVHVARSAQERYLQVRDTTEVLTQQLQRSPTVAELAAAVGARHDEVLEALDVGRAYRSDSLSVGAEDGEGGAVAAKLGIEDGRLRDVEARAVLGPALERLPTRQRELLRLRYVERLSQAEIGRALGLSQVQVSRLLRASLDQLQTALAG